MKIKGELADVLYSLYGPNGGDETVSALQKRRFAVLLELKRHGLVELTEHPKFQGMFIVTRRVRKTGDPLTLKI